MGSRTPTPKSSEEHGWDDVAVHDAIQVISYFNYVNRIAEAVRIEEPSPAGRLTANGHTNTLSKRMSVPPFSGVDEELHAHEPAGRPRAASR